MRAGTIRPGIDPLLLYISIASLCYFYISNIHTLTVVFARNLKTEKTRGRGMSSMWSRWSDRASPPRRLDKPASPMDQLTVWLPGAEKTPEPVADGGPRMANDRVVSRTPGVRRRDHAWARPLIFSPCWSCSGISSFGCSTSALPDSQAVGRGARLPRRRRAAAAEAIPTTIATLGGLPFP